MNFTKIIFIFFLAVFLFLPPCFSTGAAKADTLVGSIVFTAGDGGDRKIMLVEPSIGLPKLLVNSPSLMDTQPTVGPDGRLAWIRQSASGWDLLENGQLWGEGGMHLSPQYTPDGRLVAAISNDDGTSIYLFTAPGQKEIILLENGDNLAVSPSFSPDGGKMAYVSNRSNIAQIYISTLNFKDEMLFNLNPGKFRNTDPSWSPTGDWIAFVQDEKDIFIIKPNGKSVKQLTNNQSLNRDPSFSPDGSMIVFSSDRDGFWRLYIMMLDGSEQRPLIPSLRINQHLPVWTGLSGEKIGKSQLD